MGRFLNIKWWHQWPFHILRRYVWMLIKWTNHKMGVQEMKWKHIFWFCFRRARRKFSLDYFKNSYQENEILIEKTAFSINFKTIIWMTTTSHPKTKLREWYITLASGLRNCWSWRSLSPNSYCAECLRLLFVSTKTTLWQCQSCSSMNWSISEDLFGPPKVYKHD